MGGILELIKLIYGSKALSKVLGTRTNVIRLPDNELKQYTKSDLNIEAASDKLAQKAKADMYELLAEYPRMNDAERLIFDGNLRRLGNKLGVTQKKQGPAADVLEFGTGEKVSPEGIMSLTEKAGQKNPPTTLMGKLESRVKQLEASGEDLSKLKGKTYDEFMKDITQGQKSMRKLEDEGLVRATAREIINRDIKSGKIKLPKEIEQDIVQGGGEPINVLRQFYGEDALEQLDSMIPELRNFYTAKEAADAANKKFKFEFKADRLPESISIEDARKAEQEFNIAPKKPTEPEDPEEFAKGGAVSKGLDYLTGIERRGYAYGSGLKLLNLFKKSKTNLQKEIEKAIDNISLTGDMKLDADRVVDDMLESMNIDRDAVDGYDILDAYDKAYKKIAKLKNFNNLDNKLIDLEKKYIKNIDDKIIEEELFTPAEWAKTPETIKNKVRGQIDPEWKNATFGEDYDFDVARGKELEGGIMDISDPETLDDFTNFAKQNDPEGYKKIEDMVNEINQRREMTKGMSLEDEMNMVLNQYDKSMFIKNEQGMVDVANPENIQKMALLLQKDHPNLYKKLQEQASQVDTIENFDITGRKPNAEGGSQGLNYLTGL